MKNKTDTEIKQIALDLHHGRIFCDRQLQKDFDPALVFMPLALLSGKQLKKLRASTPALRCDMVLENPKAGRRAYKRCLWRETVDLPVIGCTYEVRPYNRLMVVLAVDRMWVHIVSDDLYTATSYLYDAWLVNTAARLIRKTVKPWRDMTEVRLNLLGS